MADVFLAKDQLLDRPVAVKVLFAQYAAEPTFVARFRREAQAAAKLNHPSIVAVYDWGQHEDTYFIVMEYIEGRTLAEFISSEGHLEPLKAASIAAEVAGALGFAHRNGTVHRDVKPGNIMITRDGQVKVADFGIARAFGGGEDELTQTGSVMGTASYFSPEQAQGKNVDPRSDLYALGVVLFEMVAGSTPFSGDSPVAIAYKHVQEPAPLVTARNASVPQPLSSIIYQLMQKDPRSRYPAAEDVRVDLKRFVEGKALIGVKNASAPASTNGTEATQVQASAPATQAMPVAGMDTGSTRAVIDTTRAVPATVAVKQDEAVEEYYEPPSRTGAFIVMLGFLLLLLVGLVFLIVQAFNDDAGSGGETDEGIKVENVVGDSQNEATQTLEALGFTVEPQAEFKEGVTPGEVFGQDPEAETLLKEGGTVTILVSKAADAVQVPQLVGSSQEKATDDLAALGLVAKPEEVASDTVEAGKVVASSPAAGSDANPGSDVTIQISTGPSNLAVPDVTNKSQTDAVGELTGAGFATEIITTPDDTIAEGNVVRTVPAAGESVPIGGQIAVYVSEGKSNVTVPNVKSRKVETAVELLVNQGFTVEQVTEELEPGDLNIGKVTDQSPQPGRVADLPFVVTIKVGVLKGTTTTVDDTSTTVDSSTTTADDNATTTVAEPGSP